MFPTKTVEHGFLFDIISTPSSSPPGSAPSLFRVSPSSLPLLSLFSFFFSLLRKNKTKRDGSEKKTETDHRTRIVTNLSVPIQAQTGLQLSPTVLSLKSY